MSVDFSAGERTVPDLIAPGSFEEQRDRVEVDGRASRVLVFDGYPRTVTPKLVVAATRRPRPDRFLVAHPAG